MQPSNEHRFYYPKLDGLRFIAFLLVFIHNANPILKGTFLDKFSAYSWFGVDLFFCLSAFLLTKLLVLEYQKTGKINIKNFYIRRALRILPLYFFYIIVGMIIIAPMEGRNNNILGHLLSLGTFTFNFAHLALHPYSISIFIPLWSISQEEQFYAIIPWFIQKVSVLQEKTKWVILIIFFLLGNLIRMMIIYFKLPSQWIYFLPFTHFDSMLGGLVVGLGLFDKLFGRHHHKILFLGIFFILLIFFFPNVDVLGWGLMLTYSLIGFGTTLIVFSITYSIDSSFKALLSNRLLAYLGKISYGLYIFHVSAFTLAALLLSKILNAPQLRYPQSTFLIFMIGFLLTILFSITSYNILEKPFLKLKERFHIISSHPI